VIKIKVWLMEHFKYLRSTPTNGHFAIEKIDAQLKQLRISKMNLRQVSQQIVKDNREAREDARNIHGI
jgi:hypothetical protein